MSIQVHEGGFSLGQLLRMHAKGDPVFRTGHLGNSYVSNLVLQAAGIPYMCFDRNYITDPLYEPSCVMLGNYKYPILSEPRASQIVGYARLDSADWLIANVHYEAFKRFGGIFELESRFYAEHAENVSQIWESLEGMYLCDRTALAEGVVQPKVYTPTARDFLACQEGYARAIEENVPDKLPEVFHYPELTFVIALMTALHAQLHDCDEVYILAGQRMTKYVKNKEGRYREIMERLVARGFLKRIPVAHVLPTTAYNVAGLSAFAAHIDQIFEAAWASVEMRRNFMYSLPQGVTGRAKKELHKKIQAQTRPLSRKIRELLYALPKPFTQGEVFFSQHDIQTKDDLYVPSGLYDLDYARVCEIDALVQSIRANT
jgi:hypothetical protein